MGDKRTPEARASPRRTNIIISKWQHLNECLNDPLDGIEQRTFHSTGDFKKTTSALYYVYTKGQLNSRSAQNDSKPDRTNGAQ
ncbi:hypothetical protein AN958_01424 [Leucoagaricus sp. SymC.cos]|nr:hypothetical protein AN958_01424 [Leucoagaricus sp. SymC.cos]